jgi:glycosyltransferase involved in cell wall biosynthesis
MTKNSSVSRAARRSRRIPAPIEDLVNDNGSQAKQIGYDLLGPVIHRYLLGLHEYHSYFDDGDTAFLFCARAGLRIKRLYELFLELSGDRSTAAGGMFWISRLSVCKGMYKRQRFAATEQIKREYYNWPLAQLVEGILRHQPDRLALCDLTREELKAHGEVFDGWLLSQQKEAKILTAYLNECSDAFEGYLGGLIEGKKRIVLIDTGWGGSAQSLLAHGFPEYEWMGTYLGRILTDAHDATITDSVIGILFENNAYDPRTPESAFTLHRHLAEQIFEPNAPSIEEIPFGSFLDAAEKLIDANLNEIPDSEADHLYLGVANYLKGNAGRLGFAEILARHQRAMAELARMLLLPTREEAKLLAGKSRSADFGKALHVPVLRAPDDGTFTTPESRVSAALWTQGQIALEYDANYARELQKQAAGLVDIAAYFDPLSELHDPRKDADLPERTQPTLAFITRTKNRPLLLRRVAESVARQTWENYVWVVVNDGGDEQAVREVINQSRIDRRRILLISNVVSVGMEAASNLGIRSSASDYICITDDDDSHAPEFAEETISFLAGPAGSRYGGVITKSEYVSEEIRGIKIIEHARQPYHDWVRNVQLAEMVCGNFFPPIAFVYRRSIWENIGGYNEALPVLGDWYFNLEFLLEANIGVIPKPLAYYHHRDRGDQKDKGVYSNSVIGGISKHEEFAAIVRNEFLRKKSASHAAASAMIIGYSIQDFRHRTAGVKGSTLDQPKDERLSALELNTKELGKMRDSADRRWVAIHLALSKKKGSWRLFANQAPKIDPDADWPELLAAVRASGRTVPVPSDFDEERYLKMNPDVNSAVQKGVVNSGYEHYLWHGRGEGRPRPLRS